jgi:hypothetical protein
MSGTENFLAALRNLKPAYPLVRRAYISINSQDEIAEACPLTALALDLHLIAPEWAINQIKNGDGVGGVVCHLLEKHFELPFNFTCLVYGVWDRDMAGFDLNRLADIITGILKNV